MNQQRMEYQVKGKVKYDLFFEGKKKKKFHVAFSLWAADKMPLHKDYKLQKPIVWETQILKNKCQTGKKQQVPLQTYPLHSSLSNQDQSPLHFSCAMPDPPTLTGARCQASSPGNAGIYIFVLWFHQEILASTFFFFVLWLSRVTATRWWLPNNVRPAACLGLDFAPAPMLLPGTSGTEFGINNLMWSLS